MPVLPRRHRDHHRHQRLLPGRDARPRPGSCRSRRHGSTTPGRPTSPTLEPGVPRSITVEGVWQAFPPTPTPSPSTSRSSHLPTTASSGPTRATRRGTSEVSNVNFEPLENRANSAIVPTSAAGTICVVSNAPTELLVDVAGYFVAGSGYQFTPLLPVRLLDTRSIYTELNPATGSATLSAGQVVQFKVAGTRGVPINAKAVSVNLTAAGRQRLRLRDRLSVRHRAHRVEPELQRLDTCDRQRRPRAALDTASCASSRAAPSTSSSTSTACGPDPNGVSRRRHRRIIGSSTDAR